MHQPDYRDAVSGEFVLPWTYLHAIKDYTDMAYHLEENHSARVNFNFVPILLDQLADYAQQFADGAIKDPLLKLLAQDDTKPLTESERRLIVDSCFKCNHEKMILPFLGYQQLFETIQSVEALGEAGLAYLSDQFMLDLLVWYHLAWTGESLRRSESVVARLMAKGSLFSQSDRFALMELIGDVITDLIPRYRTLLERGQIEISTTPHYHPILPLLLDFNAARDSIPDAPLPRYSRYPGGALRAEEHVKSALTSHASYFGETPAGVWPAEGGVSYAALLKLAQHKVKWAATGEGVLGSSLHRIHAYDGMPARKDYLYKPYLVGDGLSEITCFFRDDVLSDKIGFEYSKWFATDAVRDFVKELEHIRCTTEEGQTPVVSIILDGENAWEYYPYNAYYFLSELYQALATNHHIQMMTFSEVLKHVKPERKKASEIAAVPLPLVNAGSWVYGSFSTWIGSTEKNLAWDILCEAKEAFDRVIASKVLNPAEVALAERQLSICEGSDWFWWFGDYNSSQSVQSFDLLFRRNLSNLYKLLKLIPPATLDSPISKGGGDPEGGGTMRRGSES